MNGANLIGAALLTAGCAFIGAAKAKMLRMTVESIADTMYAVRILRAEVSVNLLPVYEICRIVSDRIGGEIGALFEQCEAFSPDRPFSEQWKQAVASPKFMFCDDLRRELQKLGDFFGRYDAEEQLKSLDLMHDRLEELRTAAAARYEQNGKLYRNVGVSVGLILGILLL